MIKVPFQALTPFLNETIDLFTPTERDEYVKPQSVEALVMLGDPYAVDNGIGPDASKVKYSVMVKADDVDVNKIIVGAWIKATSNRPKLMINSVHLNGDALWFDCTATEGAV